MNLRLLNAINIPSVCTIAISCLSLLFTTVGLAADETRPTMKHYSAASMPVAGIGATAPARGTYLGVSVVPADPALAAQLRLPEGQGLVVVQVSPGSPAELAGVRVHDVLLKLDEQILIDPRQLSVLVRGMDPQDNVSLTIVRAGEQEVVSATLLEGDVSNNAFYWRSGNVTIATPGTPYYGWRFFGGPGFDWNATRLPDDGPQSSANYSVDRAANVLKFVPPPPGPGGQPVVPGMPGEGRVMVFRPQADIVYVDDSGSMTIKVNGGGRILIANDSDDNEVFRGPIGTEEERANLPEDLRTRLEKLESLKVIDSATLAEPFHVPVPPPPGS